MAGGQVRRTAAGGGRGLCAAALMAGWVLLAAGCGDGTEIRLGVEDGRLLPCPSTPNCVSSHDASEGRQVEPFRLTVPPQQAWTAVREVVAALPRTRIIAVDDGYAHATVRSRIFGFVDDLELQLRPREGIVAIRSASRTGYWDLGVNRDRVDTLRAALRERNVIEEGSQEN